MLAVARHAVLEVVQRLGGAVEHQTNAHAGGKHHRNPGHRGELRFFVDVAQTDGAELGRGNVDHEDHKDGAEQHVCPTKVSDYEVQSIASKRAKVVGSGKAPRHNGGNQDASDTYDAPINGRVDAARAELLVLVVLLLHGRGGRRIEILVGQHVLELTRGGRCLKALVDGLVVCAVSVQTGNAGRGTHILYIVTIGRVCHRPDFGNISAASQTETGTSPRPFTA